MSDIYDLVIRAEAKRAALPFSLVKGLISVESGFNPKAFRREVKINDASRGLMQILFKTAHGIDPYIEADELFLPEVNVRIGTEYLRRQIARYHGRQWHGVSAYNMGHAKVAAVPTTICLVRCEATGKPLKEFTAQPGQFYNQPYVDKVKAAVAKYSFEDVQSGSSSGRA